MPPLNILYIHSHDTGRYVQPYGHGIATPNIQRLAEQGVLFRRAFNAAPTCSPSRAALLTGSSPHSCGMFGLVNRGFELRDRYKHLAGWLKGQGYATALAGVHHEVSDPATIGYETVVPTPSRWARDVAPAAVEHIAGRPREPFFLSVGFFETHRPFRDLTPAEDARFCLPPSPVPDTEETRADMARFKTSARHLDDGIGQVLQALDVAGLAGRTLVICTTDHGIAFPRMKCHLTDHGTGVMLIMRGPGGFTGGRVVDAMVSHIDVFPTICELIGVEPPPWLEGRSLMPVVRGEARRINDEIFAEVNYHCPYEPQRAVRTERWKYIRRFIDRETPMLANCDPSPSKARMMAAGWGASLVAREQLYDLALDPGEAHNFADDPQAAEPLAEMRGRLEAWMRRTGDPLVRGPIVAPSGAVVSRPDDVDPQDVWQYTERRSGLA